MTAQLEQILSYLDREGVTEIVISVGRPIAMKQKGAYVNLTARPLSISMLTALFDGSTLAALVPKSDGSPEPRDVEVGKRRLRVRTGRRGDEIVVRIEVAAGRVKGATNAPRTKAASASPRPARTTTSRRSKEASEAPAVITSSRPAPESIAKPSPFAGGDALSLELEPETFSLELEPTPSRGPVVTAAPARAPAPAPRQPGKPMTFAQIVAAARAAHASDLHIATGRVVSIRTNNELLPLEPGVAPLTAEAADALLLPLLSSEHKERLATAGYIDLAVDAPGGGRLRANISRHQVGIKGTFRLAHAKPSTLDELGLPKDLAKVVGHHQGFVVIAGPSGHGKTTTLAALVDLVNSTKAHHILTVEDPIEIEHPRKMAVVSQREAGRHTRTFATALKASLREDPDVIVIGELRDRETVEIALTAAETGHLVMATMSTPSAAKTIDRLIDMFPPEEHSQVRASIAGALRAIVAQRLLPAIGGGVVPAVELVTGVLPLAVLIRDDKLYQLPNLMQRGRAYGMIRFDESLAELVRAGRISEETAMGVAEAKKELASQLRGGAAAPAPAAPAPQTGVRGKLGAMFGKKDQGT